LKCEECQLEMTDKETTSCLYDVIKIDEEFYQRSRYHFSESGGRCADCGIVHGQIHHFGCDVERCPKCGLQMIGCGCVNEDNAGFFISSEIGDQESIRQPVEPVNFPQR